MFVDYGLALQVLVSQTTIVASHVRSESWNPFCPFDVGEEPCGDCPKHLLWVET